MSSKPATITTHPAASSSIRDLTSNTWFSQRTLKSLLALTAASAAGAAALYAYQRYTATPRSSSSSLARLASRRLLNMSSSASSSSTAAAAGGAVKGVSFSKKPMVVTVTGAAGQIGYSILFMIAAGRMLGEDQPIELRLLDLEPFMGVVEGVKMELDDCAFPLLTKVIGTSDYKTAFEGTEIALLIGAKPRSQGMDRKDLLKANAAIFEGQGKALDQYAARTVKVLVVGNPANTNAAITRHFAPSLPPSAFTAMTRLDQNRAQAQIARRAGVSVGDVRNVIVWGNHSNTQYPDVSHAVITAPTGVPKTVSSVIADQAWLQGEFIRVVQSRGAAIIDALKKSSAASAANAAVEHVRDWVLGTRDGEWVSMAVMSDGNSYGVEGGLCFSFPVQCKGGEWKIVDGLSVDDFSRAKLNATQDELLQERRDALGH